MDKATILVVDDSPTDLGVFFEYLEESGFEISVAQSGEGALRQLAHFQPDLILLDVVMPGMNGFETCRKLKKGKATRDIPVIFMTALSDSVDKVKGFLAGGADYITKPIQHEEVIVRITAHLTIRRLQRQIQEQQELLKEKKTTIKKQQTLLKKQENRLKEFAAHKQRLFAFILHNLQNPLNTLLGFIRVITENIESYSKEEIKSNMERLQASAEHLYALHENLLTWSAVQQGTLDYSPEPLDIQEVAVYHVLLFASLAEEKKVTLMSSVKENILAYADYTMVNTVIQNLVSNALKFTDRGGLIEIAARQTKNLIEISVSDTGVGISEARQPHLFEIVTLSQKRNPVREARSGLGLLLCKELVEKNGGKIWVESEIGKGTTFTFTLPLSKSQQEDG